MLRNKNNHSNMNLLWVAFILVTCSLSANSQTKLIRIRSIICSSSLKSVKDPTCIIKSTRQDVLLTMKVTLLRKCPAVRIALDTYRISSYDIRSHALKLDDIPICRIVRGASSSPFPAFQNAIDGLKKFDTNAFEACSTKQTLYLNNFSTKGHQSIFPPGFYASNAKFFDDIDENILNVSLNFSVMMTRKPKK